MAFKEEIFVVWLEMDKTVEWPGKFLATVSRVYFTLEGTHYYNLKVVVEVMLPIKERKREGGGGGGVGVGVLGVGWGGVLL